MFRIEIDVTEGMSIADVLETLEKAKQLIPTGKVTVVAGRHTHYDGSSDPHSTIVIEG